MFGTQDEDIVPLGAVRPYFGQARGFFKRVLADDAQNLRLGARHRRVTRRHPGGHHGARLRRQGGRDRHRART
jgi:hypothetical protein